MNFKKQKQRKGLYKPVQAKSWKIPKRAKVI